MSSLETTELKLKTTPTGGVNSEHSPYYRRLLSAGYKGYIQGTLGGAGYYGLLGLAIGGVVGIAAAPFTGGASLALIPAVAGLGVLKGADTFGNIGSTAAINAEGAELAEQRRYLLDRYYDLPEGPEGDKQAEIIREELTKQVHTREPHHLFHWKTVAVCAVIGAVLAFAFLSPMGMGLLTSGGPIAHTLASAFGEGVLAHGGAALAAHSTGGVLLSTGILTAIGTAIGALAGATIGIDRHYVRAWFDGSEKILHSEDLNREAMFDRVQQIDRIKKAAAVDNQTKIILERGGQLGASQGNATAPASLSAATPTVVPQEPAIPPSIASLDATPAIAPEAAREPVVAPEASAAPESKVKSAVLEGRMRDIQAAMQIPAV